MLRGMNTMNFKFTCSLCKKEVKRGEKYRFEADLYETDTELMGELSEDNVCTGCMTKISNKIKSMCKC